jgi:hypothetical protein
MPAMLDVIFEESKRSVKTVLIIRYFMTELAIFRVSVFINLLKEMDSECSKL